MATTTERTVSIQEAPAPVDLTTRYQFPKRPLRARLLDSQAGKIGWAILWLLGVPLPLLLVIYLIWGR